MKKIFIFILIILIMSTKSTIRANHNDFENITLTYGKLLRDFTKKDFDNYYKSVDKRKFIGWNVYEVHKNVKATFISETLFSYYNDGFTAIDYKYSLDISEITKVSLSSTGSIGYNSSNTEKGFKNGLNSSLKFDTSISNNKEKKEKYDISFKVDPGTQVNLYIYGEGRLTNGVAANYVFWIRESKGGFEYFIITTQYQRLEKVKI